MSRVWPPRRRSRLGKIIVALLTACGVIVVGSLAFFVLIGVFGPLAALIGLTMCAALAALLWRGITAPDA